MISNQQHIIEVQDREDGGGWQLVALTDDRGAAFALFERASQDYPSSTHFLRWRCDNIIVTTEPNEGALGQHGNADR